MQASPVFSILINETTDVSILKHDDCLWSFCVNGEVKTQFLGVVEVSNGGAVTITDALLEFCGKTEFDIHRQLFTLGSDGASVMLGCRGGCLKTEYLTLLPITVLPIVLH